MLAGKIGCLFAIILLIIMNAILYVIWYVLVNEGENNNEEDV